MYLKILKKTLRYGLVFIGLLIAGLLLWLNFGVYTFTNSDERQQLVNAIKASPELPERFVTIYTKVNPEEMDRSVFTWFINAVNGNYYPQPHIYVSREWAITRRMGQMQNITAMAFFLERNVSKEECLKFLSSEIDFTHNCIGAEQAALFYYKKPLASLTDDEMIGLIAMYRNPSLYNPLRKNSKAFHDRFESLKSRYVKANKH